MKRVAVITVVIVLLAISAAWWATKHLTSGLGSGRKSIRVISFEKNYIGNTLQNIYKFLIGLVGKNIGKELVLVVILTDKNGILVKHFCKRINSKDEIEGILHGMLSGKSKGKYVIVARNNLTGTLYPAQIEEKMISRIQGLVEAEDGNLFDYMIVDGRNYFSALSFGMIDKK